MLSNMANVTGQGYNQAFQQAQGQFNIEQQRGQQAQGLANQFGLQGLANQIQAGQLQRNIEQEGITADRLQFEEERDFPYKQTQYQQSLLQGLPIGAQSYSYAQPSALSDFLSGSGGVYDLLSKVFLPGTQPAVPGTYDPQVITPQPKPEQSVSQEWLGDPESLRFDQRIDAGAARIPGPTPSFPWPPRVELY
jgi:hypothetical protein